jgi:toxin YoeB
MNKVWTDLAWEDYLYWQNQDRKTLRRINDLIKDIDRNGHDGIGKPEALKGELKGFWSRRIDDKNRLVYRITLALNDTGLIEIIQCRTHYADR